MKKRLIKAAAISVLAVGLLTGCAASTAIPAETEASRSTFAVIEGNVMSAYCVLYDTTTGVMYVMSHGSYNNGTFTVMLNADGTPRIWEGWRP